MNRRQFLQWTAAVAAAHETRQKLYGASVGPAPYFGVSPRARMPQFVQPLPTRIPAVKGVVGTTIPIEMRQFRHQFHPGLGMTTVWGYTTPGVPVVHLGPTVEARSGEGFAISYSNQLPRAPLVPIDYAVADMAGEPVIRAVVHLHGGHVPPDSDGWPEDWLARGQRDVLGRDYPNDQESAMLWYHDHALGITRTNVLSGLAALWIIRDTVEDALGLPGGLPDQVLGVAKLDQYGNPYEIPLVIQDKIFQANGQLGYPGALSPLPSALGGFTSWAPEFFGDVALVNGKAWPYLEVEPRLYRLRILNGSNARVYRLSIPGAVFHVIGLEAGLLPQVVTASTLLVALAERFDVLVDFSGLRGKTVVMTNTANAPFPGGNGRPNVANPTPATTGNVLQIRVGTTVTNAAPPLPVKLAAYAPLPPPAVTRRITLEELLGADGAPLKLLINGAAWNTLEGAGGGGMAAVTETPTNGNVEVWEFINLTADLHPMHVHLVRFQVLDRIPFSVNKYLKDLAAFRAGAGPAPIYQTTGKAVKPGPDESPGWKDTVKAMPGMVTRIAAQFQLGAGWQVASGKGSHQGTYRYPYHCHIVDHEDNAMMRPFIVS